ncbi:helix-turn-helix transcriptional regulator [Paenibacillus taichungensis]|uniref:helix-turn-helix domain-containing protein n=1 Tax=Paenibacillus TaxID=44249 RepID=UPI002870E84F|nr:helix-turn-helix transcriptional regulator [Paenibacillus taichungensis]MDR9749297.1 helix-turn-helix transcriptional regulator [Paenibacillus taichungensis]
MSDWLVVIGARIRASRISKGLSQERLAELSELNASYIGKIERGEKNITVRSLEKVTTALDMPISELFEHIKPIGHENIPAPYTLAKIITLLQNRTETDQQKALELLQLVLSWND